ncbi:IclR family transcriptional regulator [Fundidesulfovibrio terrae]|uniref:IclR family transcriptional regulator n=1 Tax=Fundidesulfovibrio terrae TaxID=2922866 RepID=UPI001FB01448|nr:IclR family transcriptional regulator [Fundidesulfovibrio terrae]
MQPDTHAPTSLDKALALLDGLGRLGRAGIKALSEETSIPAPTVHRLLGVLGRSGYVRQDPDSRQYHLSLKLLELGAKVRTGLDLAAAARPLMRELAESTRETVNLVVFDNQEAVYVEQESGARSMLRMFTRVGARVALYCSGVGKAFLAAGSDEAALDYLAGVEAVRHTPRTIVAPEALLDELARIRRHGYAVDDEEMEEGVRCVAALILRASGEPAGAMSLSGPSARLTPERLPELGLTLARAAEAISAELGWRPRTNIPGAP